MDESRLCRHCRRAVVSKPRRLCWRDFQDPAVRALYPPIPAAESGAKGGRAGRGGSKRRYPPAPGTPDG